MQAPTSIKIWAPASSEAFDATAEPTMEDQNGSDVLGAAIADTEQAVNTMDGRPGQLLTVDTSGEKSTWRIDLEANIRKTYDALIVDNHNLLSAYPLAIRDLLNIYKHTADDDALASATEVAYTKIMSGLLGRGRPRLDFDGINNYVTKSDDANLKFGENVDFSVFSILETIAEDGIIAGKGSATRRYYSYLSSGIPYVAIQGNGGSTFPGAGAAINDGDPHSHCYTVDRDGTLAHYIDGVASGTPGDVSSVGDIDAAKPYNLGINPNDNSSNPFGGKQWRHLVFNRKLSAAEVLVLHNGWTHTPVPVADQGANMDELIENGTFAAWTTDNPDDWAITGESGADPQIAEVGAGEFHGDINGNTGYANLYDTKDNRLYITQTISGLTIGYTYRIIIDIDGANSGVLFCQETARGDFDDQSYATSGYKIIDFTAAGTSINLRLRTGAGDTCDITVDSISMIRTGCVLEYSHDSISKELAKLLDASGNDLHGTINGCEYMDCPDDDNFGFYLAEFTAVVDWLFWFLQFVQDDGATNASADTYLGWLPLLKSYTFGDLVAGGYAGDHSFGVASRVSDVGRVLAEEIHGEQPSWSLSWQRLTTAQWADLVEMLRIIKPGRNLSLYPFYICFNYDARDPVIWRVRMSGPLAWAYNGANTYKWSPSMTLVRDL